MLHAFVQKNARRVLAFKGEEHSNDKNEDAITSMVFSPLAFMPPEAAIEILGMLAGSPLSIAVAGRTIKAHTLQLWPKNLSSKAWRGEAASRCEPDLFVILEFTEGAPIAIIGEMKWDWNVGIDHLMKETGRQRSAVAEAFPGVVQLVLVITKYRLQQDLPDTRQLTWVQVQQAASNIARTGSLSSSRNWGALVSQFLTEARQTAFQGFRSSDFAELPSTFPLFWAISDA